MRNNFISDAFKKKLPKSAILKQISVFRFLSKNSFLEDLGCSNQIEINLTLIDQLPYECVRVIDSLIPGFREPILYFFFTLEEKPAGYRINSNAYVKLFRKVNESIPKTLFFYVEYVSVNLFIQR